MGCEQREFVPFEAEIQFQKDFYGLTFSDDHIKFKAADSTILTEQRSENLSKRNQKDKQSPNSGRKAKLAAATLPSIDRSNSEGVKGYSY